eukprot:COSAG06_NODE_12846_length_1321_cov_1.129296_2_plen_177_part_00
MGTCAVHVVASQFRVAASVMRSFGLGGRGRLSLTIRCDQPIDFVNTMGVQISIVTWRCASRHSQALERSARSVMPPDNVVGVKVFGTARGPVTTRLQASHVVAANCVSRISGAAMQQRAQEEGATRGTNPVATTVIIVLIHEYVRPMSTYVTITQGVCASVVWTERHVEMRTGVAA